MMCEISHKTCEACVTLRTTTIAWHPVVALVSMNKHLKFIYIRIFTMAGKHRLAQVALSLP
jgi:hypothetical protein